MILGSVLTNNGFSDWATTVIDASVKSMWYRFSGREDDYCIEWSAAGLIREGVGQIPIYLNVCSMLLFNGAPWYRSAPGYNQRWYGGTVPFWSGTYLYLLLNHGFSDI